MKALSEGGSDALLKNAVAVISNPKSLNDNVLKEIEGIYVVGGENGKLLSLFFKKFSPSMEESIYRLKAKFAQRQEIDEETEKWLASNL